MSIPALTTQLGAPSANYVIDGYYGFIRFWRHEQAAAAPGNAFSIQGADTVTADPATPKVSKEIFQIGGGDEFYSKNRQYQFSGVVNMLAGAVPAFLAEALGITYNLSSYVGLSLVMPYHSVGTIECAFRSSNNRTHLGSVVYHDITLMPFNFGLPKEDSMVAVPFKCARYPLHLYPGSELVYDQFTGDGSTNTWTSSSVPLWLTNCLNAGNEDFYLDNALWVKKKLSGAVVGTRWTSCTFSAAKSLVITDAIPAVASTIQLMYVKATV
jgi:hypothetical protein